jgi:O-antigen/teichoic acid export membrane protein
MLRYAVPLIPSAALWWVLAVSDRYILLHTHGQAITGVYAAAGKLPALLTFATGLFLEAWHFAVIHESEEGRRALFERIYGALLPALVIFVGALILLSDWLVRYLFAADFREAARFVPFLAIAAMFSALSSFLGSVYVVRLRSGASLTTAAVGAGVNLALDAWWIPSLGVWGAVCATLISYLFVFLWRVIHCKRVLPFHRHSGKLTISSVLLLLAALLTVQGARIGACVCTLLALLPFWRQMGDSVRTLWHCGQKILHISTKKRNLS